MQRRSKIRPIRGLTEKMRARQHCRAIRTCRRPQIRSHCWQKMIESSEQLLMLWYAAFVLSLHVRSDTVRLYLIVHLRSTLGPHQMFQHTFRLVLQNADARLLKRPLTPSWDQSRLLIFVTDSVSHSRSKRQLICGALETSLRPPHCSSATYLKAQIAYCHIFWGSETQF